MSLADGLSNVKRNGGRPDFFYREPNLKIVTAWPYNFDESQRGRTMYDRTAVAAVTVPSPPSPFGRFPRLTLTRTAEPRTERAAAFMEFTVLVSPQVSRPQPLPAGLDGAALRRYMRAYADASGFDCCLQCAGRRTEYFLSDGTGFTAVR